MEKTFHAEEKEKSEKAAKRERKYLRKGRIINLRLDTIRIGDVDRTFEIVEHPGAVAMIPITADGKILLVRQWRRAIEKIILEIPAGTLEKDEEPAVCAQRELQEEIGFYAHKLTHLGGFYTAPGFCSEYIHLYLAENLEKKALEADEDEGIDVVAMTLQEALHKVKTNEINDAKTILALCRYQLEHARR